MTTTALLLLTAAAGVGDAVGYLALGSVFTGNMTGNVLFLGFALVGEPHVPLLGTVVALGAFVVGAVVAGRAVPRSTASVVPRATLGALVVVTAAGAVLCAVWLARPDPGRPALLVVTGVLAALSGAQAAAVRPVGNADITTVVVTSTLVNLARDGRPAGRAARLARADRVLAVLAVAAGAALGAVLVRGVSTSAALAAVVVLRAAAVASLLAARRRQQRQAATEGRASTT
ncbi:DUF1275 domain-containing protein [Cellulomonas sp. zg-Y908]|nr:DUF1275 domain-containing protein [Cellulomonas wangsupingiae]